MMITRREQAKLKKLQAICDEFNADNPVGTEVLLKKDFQDELFPTKTRSTAQIMCGHSAVIWLENVSGCYLLDRVTTVRLSENQQRVFNAYNGLDHDTGFHFKDIEKRTGLKREVIRPAVRHLAQLGYLEFFLNGVTDEGDFYGAGYAITSAGRAALAQGGESDS